MLLTVSKRLEFSASRRLFVPEWTESENLNAFGPETGARYGSGRNYVAYFVFTGSVDPTTGTLINISEIKERAGKIVRQRFDHKFLNEDNPSFRDIAPTAENIARQLYIEVAPLFSDTEANLCACHLTESPERSATYYSNGACEANYWFEFSAARKTMSPYLSAEENARSFGESVSMHGHNYRARLTFRAERSDDKDPMVRYDAIDACIRGLRTELDHRYLNEVNGLKERPTTTESLAGYIYERVNTMFPLRRVRLHERDDFFAEAWESEIIFLGLRAPFHAAHRLHVATLSDAQNASLYGKRHLDLETEDFRDAPSTGENIVRALWPKIDNRLNQRLVRLRLWETTNNRFTLRRT